MLIINNSLDTTPNSYAKNPRKGPEALCACGERDPCIRKVYLDESHPRTCDMESTAPQASCFSWMAVGYVLCRKSELSGENAGVRARPVVQGSQYHHLHWRCPIHVLWWRTMVVPQDVRFSRRILYPILFIRQSWTGACRGEIWYTTNIRTVTAALPTMGREPIDGSTNWAITSKRWGRWPDFQMLRPEREQASPLVGDQLAGMHFFFLKYKCSKIKVWN